MPETDGVNVKAVMEQIKQEVYGKEGGSRSQIPQSLYESIRQLGLLETLDGNPPVMTHHPSLGWIILPAKRLVGRLMKWYVKPITEKTSERNHVEAEVALGLLRQIERIDRELRNLPTAKRDSVEDRTDLDGPQMNRYPDWYFGLESRMRGPSEKVAEGYRNYLGLFENAKRVLDLGCGRGEFLEMLHRAGIPCEGVEIDPDMVAVCREKGLNVEQGDLFDRLRREPNDSLDGVFCSHVVEHFSPEEILDLVRLAFHRLRGRGVLVIETLNPQCLSIFSGAFYADPTHKSPIHPEVLKYFVERTGFGETDVWYSAKVPPEGSLELLDPETESAEPLNRNFRKLNSLLYGYAHYAIVGRKK